MESAISWERNTVVNINHPFVAIANLSGVTLYGQKIHVTMSKHAQVQMPQAGSNVCCYFCPSTLHNVV